MKTIELLEKLKRKSVFKVQDMERLARVNRSYSYLILHRLVESGLVKRIKRNAYTLLDDIWTIASNLSPPAYISFWSASYYNGYTTQILNTVQMATPRLKETLAFNGQMIKFIPIPCFFGFRKIRTNNGSIFVVEDEKLVIDAFLRPEEMGNMDEIVNVFKNADFDRDRLVDYLRRCGKQSIIKRVGYLLELTREIDISGSFTLDRNYVNLNPFSRKWSKTNNKWRLRI